MSPSQPTSPTEIQTEKPARASPSAERAADKSNGEGRSFSPRDVWREDQADADGSSYVEPAIKAGQPATSEIATNLREAMQSIASMQLAGGRMFDDWLWRMVSWNALPTLWPAEPLRSFGLMPMGLPPVDVKESDQGYSLCLELPGLTAADVDVQIHGGVMVVSGEKNEAKETTRPTYHLSERRFGRFERRFPVPADADRSKMSTKVSDGVLSIVLPKATSPA